jgi:tight adherence protein B
MELQIILGAVFLVVVASSVIATRIFVKRRERSIFRGRVEDFVPLATPRTAVTVAAASDGAGQNALVIPEKLEEWLRRRIELAGWNSQPADVLLGSICLLLGVGAIAYTFTPLGFFSAAIGIAASIVPVVCLNVQAARTKNKLEMQLPNALDLMVSVLRSGHSVPQSIKAVANEMPNPCGREFAEILHRVNLGQTLPDALTYTVARYQSFELDLLRRAFNIHADVGGSLAELLEKTNTTLRGRIKLKRHVQILTAPSKLTATIVSLLPFVVAGGCFAMAPDYLSPLLKTKIGNVFIGLGLMLQVMGLVIMRRMATFKV